MQIISFFNFLQYEKRFSINTIIAYKSDLDQFSIFYNTSYQCDDSDLLLVTHRQIRSWIVALINAGVTAKSVNRKISTLKTYYKFLFKNKVIDKSPTAKIVSPKIPSKLPVFLDKNNIEAVFLWIEASYKKESTIDLFIFNRDKLIIEFLYGTGIRRSELLGLKRTNINYDSHTIKVLGKGNKERIIPAGIPIFNALQLYFLEYNKLFKTEERIFLTHKGKELKPHHVYSIVHHILSNTTTLSKKSPHILRHTFATHLSDSGADLNAIKELLGHASLASTQVYTHNTIDKLKKIHKQAHPKA